MSFIPVLQYGIGIGFFGFIYWILDAVMDEFVSLGIHESGNTYTLLMYMWTGVLIIYLIFGGWWVIRKYNENQYMQGGMM